MDGTTDHFEWWPGVPGVGKQFPVFKPLLLAVTAGGSRWFPRVEQWKLPSFHRASWGHEDIQGDTTAPPTAKISPSQPIPAAVTKRHRLGL